MFLKDSLGFLWVTQTLLQGNEKKENESLFGTGMFGFVSNLSPLSGNYHAHS